MSTPKLPTIQTLLIDLDGTLIHQANTFMTPLKFLWRLFPKLKLSQSHLQTWRNIKQGGRALQAGHEELTNFARMVNVFEKNLALSKTDAENLILASFKHAYPSLKPFFKPLVGASEFIEWAKDRYALILATNPVWTADLVKERMAWGNINPEHFKRITTSDQMNYCKPAPEFYCQILKQENLDPRDCLMIGNEEKMDLPATQAGIPVFLIDQKLKCPLTIQTPTETLPGAWKGSYKDLKAILEN